MSEVGTPKDNKTIDNWNWKVAGSKPLHESPLILALINKMHLNTTLEKLHPLLSQL